MNDKQVNSLVKNTHSQLKETHISWVLLKGKYAYKIKKPLKTTFLDFSSLAKRKNFCLKEVQLNSALVPEIYLDVVPVYGSMKGLMIDKGEGKILDYAVKMKRLNQEKQMDYMLKKNLVKEYHLKKIAKILAAFHKKAAIVKKKKTIQDLFKDFDDIRLYQKAVHKQLSVETENDMLATIGRVRSFLEVYEEVFMQRIKNGFTRDCHGDLHSGNIFLYSHPLIFDRIEFNDRFRYIDVLHEVAFFCMDLEAFGKNKLSSKFLEYYIDFSGIEFGGEGQKIVNYYKCYTANVRAKVNLLKGKNEGVRAAKKYLNLMNRYAKIL